jgi:hypothetical protein
MSVNHQLFPMSTTLEISSGTKKFDFDLRSEIQNLNVGSLTDGHNFGPLTTSLDWIPCNLKLPEGCYKIGMSSNSRASGSRVDFVGTLRIELAEDSNGNTGYEISGDLYRNEVKGNQPFPIEAPWPNNTAQKIPIYGRSRYHSYLKIIDIAKPAKVPSGSKCTITLTLEQYYYTPPATDAGHGSFPSSPSQTLTIVFEKARPPSGHTGPYYEGKVFQGTNQLSTNCSIEWVSTYFRKASIELESVVGAAIPDTAGPHNFRSIYASTGWDVDVITGDTNLPVPVGVSAANPWSNAELHEFMVSNRNPRVNLDRQWQYYYVAVPHTSDQGSLFGIMFDTLGDHREGSCNFINNMTGDFDDAFSKLRSAAHEIGHGFNQLHPQNESPLLATENFIMTQSGTTRSAIINAGGTYPDDIRFEFSPHHVHHLKHAPDVVVRPGGEDFGFGHATVLAGSFNPEDVEIALELGLLLKVDAVRSHIKLGEPLQMKVRLTNNGSKTMQVPETISWMGMNTNIAVALPGGDLRRVSSFIHVCDSKGNVDLDPGKFVDSEALVFWDTNGFVFSQPGVHKVEVQVRWNMSTHSLALTAEKYIWVDYPVTAKENEAAALLMHPEVGKYVALGGNANHLHIAVDRIANAEKYASHHPGYDCIAALNARHATKPRNRRVLNSKTMK